MPPSIKRNWGMNGSTLGWDFLSSEEEKKTLGDVK